MDLPPKKLRLFSELKNSHPSFIPHAAKELSVSIKTIGIIPNFNYDEYYKTV